MRNMRFFAHHGVFPEENRLGQTYIVDLELFFDLRAAGRSDDLNDTINYAELYERVRAVVCGETYNLIERLAQRLAETLLDGYPMLDAVTVRVIKPNPPFDIQFDGVCVEIHRRRPEVESS
ncbi:dihydroneopterin aldolase [Paenibacillus thermoaerophilus]